MNKFYLWSVRSGGWFSRSGTYTTDVKEAASFTHDEAVIVMVKHKDQGSHKMLPVPADML